MSVFAERLMMSAAGGSPPVYIEDVFSTFLYTGNGGTQTITNGIDLATKGGLVWAKIRNQVGSHEFVDTVRGGGKALYSHLTNSQTSGEDISGFTASGFLLNGNSDANYSGARVASWTFRKQPKFFDVVTYTGDGGANQLISHNLGSVPGAILIKRLDSTSNWPFWRRNSSGDYRDGWLNLTEPSYNTADVASLGLTTTQFNAGKITQYDGYGQSFNASGGTYVAYLFAHNAGGFGSSGNDNVISCGSYTGGSGTTFVTLGYEPQFILKKNTTSSGNWVICDNMRGMPTGGNSTANLFPNTSGVETSAVNADGYLFPTATGFGDANANSGQTYIYIAIRRGPMRTPTSGTSVYNGIARTGTGAAATVTGVGFAPDLAIVKLRSGNTLDASFTDKLRGATKELLPSTTAAEATEIQGVTAFLNDGVTLGDDGYYNQSNPFINWFFRRAPGFFDVVCYTGTGVARTVSHNLGVVPELMIVKVRNLANSWMVYAQALGATKELALDWTGAFQTSNRCWNDVAPTSTVFTVGTYQGTNGSGYTYVAYLFASCPGVSKVGTYTGNGSSQTINCGFTAGARFVMIKRTDSPGDWYVWDTARGIVSANDPHLSLNSTAAEVTTNDSVDPESSGFIVNQVAATNINVNGATYIYLAIA
jgi:hypothetical protein